MTGSKLYVQLLSGSQEHRRWGKPEEVPQGVGRWHWTVGFLRTGLRTGTEPESPVGQENEK